MNRRHAYLCLCAIAGASVAPVTAFAQTGGPYDLTWNTIDSGGIMFAIGGVYELGGTIGQADAGVVTGGAYHLSGGFWFDAAVPSTPNPPTPSTSKLNRYLLFTDTNGGNSVAYRVTAPGMASARYVQTPGVSAPAGISRLGCEAVLMDWNNAEIRVGDPDVQPGSGGVPRSYTIEATSDTVNFAAGVVVQTASRWCDTNNTGTVSNLDIIAVLNGFQGIFTMPNTNPPRKETVDFRAGTGPAGGVPSYPDFSIGNLDIVLVLNAFQGSLYPYIFSPICP